MAQGILDFWRGLLDEAQASNGDQLVRMPDGSIQRTSARYGWTENAGSGAPVQGGGILSAPQQEAPQQPQQQAFQQEQPVSRGTVGTGGGFGDAIGGLLSGLMGGRRGPSNQTVQYLVGKGFDPAAAQAIASDPATLRRAVVEYGGPQAAADPLEAEYKKAQIDNMRSQIDERNAANSGDARKTYGNEVIWAQKPNGKWAAMRTASDGSLVEAPVDENLSLAPPGVSAMNLGTKFAIRDRAGNIVGYENIDNEGKARDTAIGSAVGGDTATYDSIASKMPGLEKVVSDLENLANKATYTVGGVTYDTILRQTGQEPREAAVARAEYISMVDNQVLPLLRDTFGAQFTQREGETLRATLGNPDLSPPEKKAVLRSFIEQKRRDVEALGRRTGRIDPGAERMGTAGEWQEMGNGVKIRRKQ